jgi:histidinol-phosphatase (PHP family)
VLPPDYHAHTEWSWDAPSGSMELSCVRAQEIGLSSIAFTEHVDLTHWVADPSSGEAGLHQGVRIVSRHGSYFAAPLDLDGYMECIERCRSRFRGLRILTGIELGEPHWHQAQARTLIADLRPDLILGSLHSLGAARPRLVEQLYESFRPDDLIRAHLAETLKLVESSRDFAVLAHIDYPVRSWPVSAGRFDPTGFEEEYRAVLGALARSGRALELNTTIPMPFEVLKWWHELGGEAITFGSDAHDPSAIARGFAEAAAMAEQLGFRAGRFPHDFWRRAAIVP